MRNKSLYAYRWTSAVLGLISLGAGTNILAVALRYWIGKNWINEDKGTGHGIKVGVIAFVIHMAISITIFTLIGIFYPEALDYII